MKRIVTVAIWAAFAGLLLSGTTAQAQTASSGLRIARAPEPAVTDVSAQRRRPLRRVPIYRQEEWAPDVYPRYNPGPNAVRDCTAHYVQEYRPSGTVITPRMNCYWRPG
jgi:DNA-binding transcriptional LysR family regulator